METAASWDKLTDALVGTYEDDILDGLLGAYQSLEGRIEVAYKAAQRPGASTFPLQRLLSLRKELEGQLSQMKLPDSLKAKVIKALEDGQMAADYWAAIEINKIDPGAGVLGVEITPGMAQQNPEALVAAAQRQTALRNYALWEVDPKAAQVIDLIDKHAVDLRGRIMGAVEFHLAQADSWTSLRKTLRDSFKLTRARAQMVARTEMSSAMITGKKMRYEAEGIEYIQIIATGSDRTCGYCAPRHNYVYEIGKVTVILHPNCRCTSIPWREEWVEQGLVDPKADAQSRKEVLEDLKAAGKEPINGPAPFERSLGLDEAPKPFWKPEAGAVEPKEKATPKPKAKPKTSVASTGPAKLKRLARTKTVSFKGWDRENEYGTFQYPTLDDVYKRQGDHQGKPVLVGTMDDLLATKGLIQNQDGETVVIYRGVTGPDQKQQFLGKGPDGGRHFAGKGIFGNGTYGASKSAWDQKLAEIYTGDPYESSDKRAKLTASLYANKTWYESQPHKLRKSGKKREDVFKDLTTDEANLRVTAYGLRKDAKIKTFANFKDPDKAVDAYEQWTDEVYEEAKRLGPRRSEGGFDDFGEAAAALGWDGYQVPAPDFDTSQDYWVILNRRAVVAVEGDAYEEAPKL